MAEHTAFFYGTLMAPQVLSRVCHGTHTALANPRMTVRPAVLHGFRRHKVCDADYPAIIPRPGDGCSVRGTVVSGLSDGDMWRLDIFEGDEYERRRVKVRVLAVGGDEDGVGQAESEEDVDAETYVWIAGSDRLEASEWDFREFVREKMVRWVGVEGQDEYKEVDEAVKSNGDPTGGRGLTGHIGQAVEASRSQPGDALTTAV